MQHPDHELKLFHQAARAAHTAAAREREARRNGRTLLIDRWTASVVKGVRALAVRAWPARPAI